jgi:phage baseplate assembly protein W
VSVPAQRLADDVLGRDLLAVYGSGDGRQENLDVATSVRVVKGRAITDLTASAGVDTAVQAVIHRIKTVRGELADLGHSDYGSRHHELIGQPNTVRNRNLVKLYVLQALAQEPRIQKILAATVEPDPQRDRATISLTIRFIDAPVPLDLVIPFSFEGAP